MLRIMRGSLPEAGLDAESTLRRAAELGISEVIFYSLFELSQTLDQGELSAISSLADELGVKIGANIEWLNPLRPSYVSAETALGNGDYEAGLELLLRSAAQIGISEMMFTMGKLEDREDHWADQLEAVSKVIIAMKPVLAECDLHLMVKTHEEISSFDVLRLIYTVGPDTLSVSFDPTNILIRMEHPVAAARRLSQFTRQVHIDDAILKIENGAVRRFLCPLGDGSIDWPTILAILPSAHRVVELHRGQFSIPAFDPSWLAKQDYLTVPEYASIVAMAVNSPDCPTPDQSDLSARFDAACKFTRQGLST